VNGVSVAGMSLSEAMDSFLYLNMSDEMDNERIAAYPWVAPQVKLITYDQWYYGINSYIEGEIDGR
jgi:hypothetical protein